MGGAGPYRSGEQPTAGWYPVTAVRSFTKTRLRKLIMPATCESALTPLVGSWRPQTPTATFTDTVERVETFGPNPSGRMVVTHGGRITFPIS